MSRIIQLPNAEDPALLAVNRLRHLQAELTAEEPLQSPQHMYDCGCGFCRGVVGEPPTFAEMMAVVNRRGRRGRLKGVGHGRLTS